MSKRKGNQRDTGLIGMNADEIERRAKDPNYSKQERRRYGREAKALKRRNKQKRGK